MNQPFQLFVLAILFLIALSNSCQAQAPATNIVLFDLEVTKDGFFLSNKTRITQNDGYNNQPFFESENSLLYTTDRDGDQTEIYRYKIKENMHSRLTFTEESEYSPTIIPGTSDFSVVRVEADDSTQRVWKFRGDGKNPQLLMEQVRRVGYHAWIDYSTMALFILGNEFTLQTTNVREQKLTRLASNIGRSIHKIPGRNAVSFVDKSDSTRGVLKSYDIQKMNLETITTLKTGSEDYTWSSLGFVLMGSEGKLWKLHPGKQNKWQEVADMALFDSQDFYRLAISPDNSKLAIVVFSGEKP